MKAINALYEAQKIAFSPFVFQTVICMYELDIFKTIDDTRPGISVEEIAKKTKVSPYGVRVLLEMAEAAEIVVRDQNNLYQLSKVGYFLLNDEMTRVNMMFTQYVNYQGLFFLKEAILNGKPEGLRVLGDWKTVYEGLSKLPDHVKKAWFEFDHYYSDNSFDNALKIIFRDQPKMIYDIGGNTGKWAIASTKYNPEVEVTIFDLPGQLNVAKENIEQIPEIRDRVHYHQTDMLDSKSEIPAGADVYWMSQFLDCFGEDEITAILEKIRKHCSMNSRVYIMETFIDDQKFPAATYSLVATSLYFTVMANGNSKMYHSEVMKKLVEKAGFKCVDQHTIHEQSFHTILELKPI